MNNIDENILKKIKQYSLSNMKEEVCGFIYINNLKQKFFSSNNISFDRKNSFLINPEDYEKCNFKGNILCCFHSHINNRGFSPEDIRESLKNNLPYLLYNTKQDKFYYFDAIKYKYYEKYIDIPYRNGITDCWSILSYFYKNELNIKIENIEPGRESYPDEHLWAKLHQQMYNYNPFSMDYELRKDFFTKNNFIKIEKTDPRNLKPYDILFFKHIGDKDPFYGNILLPPGDLILQHIDQKPSKISSLSPVHFRMTEFILRNKNFL
jgi:proteasome lid subunit RPN8/RPN11